MPILRFIFFLLLAIASTPAAEPRIQLEKSPGKLLVRARSANGGDWFHLATYVMQTNSRSYLHPVHDPSGRVVLTEDRPADHPWQHGIFTGFHRVNGFNYWKEDEGTQRFVRLLDLHESPNHVSWRALVELVAPGGTVVLEEEDTITIHAPESTNACLIDFDLLLRAKDRDVNFGKFFVGGLAVRMPWDKDNPRQTHLNSNGLRNRACEQQRAAWCNVERPFGAETFGIAILDHPTNPNHPPGWRADEQGLINPNVSALADWSLPAGRERLFRHRLVLYRGAATRDQLQARFADFASEQPAAAAAQIRVHRDIPYTDSGDERHKLDIYAPPGARNLPVVFWIHGGGWQVGHRSTVQIKPRAFAAKNFVFVSTGYRLLPDVEMVTIFRDIAKSIRWVHDHIAEYGGDPKRLLVMGHSAGAQLAALISIDDRYLKAEGLSLDIIKACVPVDGDTFDVPAIIETAETRRRVHQLPQARLGHRQKFGNHPDKHRDYSAVTHVAKDKGIPPFFILHVAEHPDTSAQAERLAAVLKQSGIPVTRFPARQTTHDQINENLGLPGDPATQALFEFITTALKSSSN